MKSPRPSDGSPNASERGAESGEARQPLLAASMSVTYRTAKRIVVLVIGGTLFVVGAILIFSPMPGAAAVAIVGLAILGAEFEFARRWLAKFKEKSAAAAERLKARKNREER